MSERFVAHVSRWRILLLVLGALVFVALGAMMVADPDGWRRYSPEMIRIFGWVAVLFFGACGIVAVRQLFRTGPVMEIGPQGLRWRRWSDETIPWMAFTRAAVMEVRNQKMLCLWFADPGAHRSTTLIGRTAGANKSMGYGDVALTAQGTDRRFDDMADAVYAHAPQLFSARA